MKGVMLGQNRHQAILRRHLAAVGGNVEFNTSLITLNQEEDGVIAEISKTTDGKQAVEKIKYAYVIGADGARSTSLSLNILGLLTRNTQVLCGSPLESISLVNLARTLLYF